MHARVVKWLVVCLLLCAAGAWFLWRPSAGRLAAGKPAPAPAPVLPGGPPGAAPLTNPALVSAAEAKTNRLAYRLSNTTRPLSQLIADRRAILLENALIDLDRPVNFIFPANLQSQGDPGAYIVQARGPVTPAFRALLAQAGAQIVAYIPNDAFLVRLPGAGANALAAQPPVQTVLPYEPYYKIQLPLLGPAVTQNPLPGGAELNLGLFADAAPQTVQQIESQPGVQIVGRDTSPFGPVVRVQLSPAAKWTALADLPGVQIVEPYHARVMANDLSRVTVGVATNTIVPTNYMLLTGQNVMVAVDDSGIDAAHPDFDATGGATTPPGGPSRVLGYTANDLTDTNGHGTHVAGTIAGNGAMSSTCTNAEGSVSNADFRGMAPMATLFSINFGNSDQTLQEEAALTNALISNNSWGYGGDSAYDLAAASYDAATRDALPEVTGSQPVLFVFSAGNDGHIGLNPGNGDDNGGGGSADTISSPGTAKDVITVGALEQLRDITNVVTDVNSNQSAVWYPETDTGFQVAGYSSRGNVGIGIEGAFGRFKPDVAAPGTFVVSTSSQFNHQWATNAYYNPTNYAVQTYSDQIVNANNLNYYSLIVPQTAVGVTIQIQSNPNSPNPFPTNLQIFVSEYNYPDPMDPSTYDFVVTGNEVDIPPDTGGVITGIQSIQGIGFNFAVYNTNSSAVDYNVTTEVTSTNDLGDFYSVLEGMNDSLGYYYRYESGTSMAAADVSGVLALMMDFFTNTLHQTPSPALLKAMLINGARPSGLYNLQVDNTINYEGWGLVNLPNSLPTNNVADYFSGGGSVTTPLFIQDQSPTNALATGDSHSYSLTTKTNLASLHVTLTWTDPPGDPVAALKLVNSLELVVSNSDNPASPVVFYGNDIAANADFNTPENPTNPPAPDAINNVQSIILPAPLGTNYTIFVIGRDVNVNAVSAQTNLYLGALSSSPGVYYAPNIVQDYALVISSGNQSTPGSFTIADNGIVSNPTADQNVTIISTTNTYTSLLDQFVGANSPVLNTNFVPFTTNTAYGTAQDSRGTTNQWHFYVITNTGPTANYTNAAIVIYASSTLSVPRMGVFAGSNTNATMPQANIDLYATTDPSFTILNPVVISNCINAFANGPNVYYNASLGPGGAKFLVDTNSTPGEVYYVGVKSEDQMAAEYNFLAVFSQTPFNSMNNGDEILNGLTVPVAIPGGTPSVPGFVDVVAIGVQQMNVGSVVVTNVIQELDVGDLVSTLSFNNINVGLMSHTSPNSAGTFGYVYDDSGVVNPATVPAGYTVQGSDGPGSLLDYVGQSASAGVWVFHMANTVAPFTGTVGVLSLRIHPQLPLTGGITNVIPPHTMIYDPVDVPAGATNLTINATNITASPDLFNPLLMVLKFGSQPTLTNADKGPVALTNGIPVGLGGAGLGNSLSVGPSDVPPIQPGRYWIGITNQSDTAQTNTIIAVILPPNPSSPTTDFASPGSTPLLDDAVTYSGIYVTNTMPIISLSVGIEVQHPRISDLAFYLISPDGTRDLLMENRGGDTANAGATVTVTNIVVTTNTVSTTNSLAGPAADYTNGQSVAGWTVGANQVSVVNDPLSAAPGNNNLLALAGGSLSTTFATVPGQTYTVSFPYRGPGIAGWWRGESNANDSINGDNGVLMGTTTNYTTVWTNGFGGAVANSTPGTGGVFYFASGWHVESGSVDWLVNGTGFGTAYSGNAYIDLNGSSPGVIATNIATVPGMTYTLGFAYTKNPAIAAPQAAVVVNNNSIGSVTPNIPNSFANLNWQTTNFVFTATTASTHLAFVSTNTPGTSGVFLDAISLTTNVLSSVTYTNGEVGQAFSFDNSGVQAVDIPRTSILAITNRVTVECWMNANAANSMNSFQGLLTSDYYWINIDVGNPNLGVYGVDFAINDQGTFYQVANANGGGARVSSGAWHHVLGTYDGTALQLYIDGQPWGNPMLHTGAISPMPLNGFVSIASEDGRSTCGCPNRHFWGLIDEGSIYNRALSDSEIKAIYNLGTNGKFDPVVFNTSPALSLAEATAGLTGQSTVTLYGNNTLWQTYSATFKAVSGQTTLSLAGVEPGMLLGPLVMTDPVLVTNVVTNVYYLTFTDDTNLTTTPIKFAVPPFVPDTSTGTVFADGFEQTAATNYPQGSTFSNGWTVTTNEVSVVTDPTNAYEGSNFLALADGAVSNLLPTVAGNAYTLTFAYRGPGIAAWWRAESNAIDSINGNNGATVQNITYSNGEVGQAFDFAGSGSSYVRVPASPSIDVGQNNGFTLELWCNPANTNAPVGFTTLAEWNNNSGALTGIGCHLEFYNGGQILGDIVDPNTGNDHFVESAGGNVAPNVWQHVAMTYDKTTGILTLYRNGAMLTSGNVGIWRPSTSFDLYFGIRSAGVFAPGPYQGLLDETSLYSRALSASEINAIYQGGTNGKFDPVTFSNSPAQSLAEAQVSLDGQSQGTLYGNNTNWQVATITFTATQNGTPLAIAGLEPGMLLDDFILTQTPTNLYVQPEQSLDLFDGKGAAGLWQLEIQDDRAGAGLTNALVSWDLQFVFADTNPVPLVLTGGVGQNNQFLPAGSIAWYQVNVPATANYATNRLLFASAPVNLWFDTNSPPTTNILLLPDGAYPGGTNGSVLLSTTNAVPLQPAPNIYDGQTYYLGVQNTNVFTVNYGIEVDFDTTPFVSSPPVLPAQTNVTMNELTTLVVANTATDASIPPPTLSYTLTMVVDTNLMIANGWPTNYATTNPPPYIGPNGIIIWTPDEAQGPGIYTITTVVTDNGTPPLSATNSFMVTVNEVNTPPAFIYPTNTTVLTILSTVPYTNYCFATDPDIPADLLTFALVNGPAGLTVTTNGVIAWTPAIAQAGTNLVTVSVTDTNFYALINQTYSVTNIFTIIVTNTPPVLPALADTNINELTPITVTNTATDPDSPPLTLTYTVSMVVDTNLMIASNWPTLYATTNPSPVISTNGIITWTPSNAQGPGIYTITTVVTDNGTPPSSATNSFMVIVNEVNTAPFWPANVPSQTNYTINALQPLVVANTATDADIPPVPLTYQLSGPAGAVIDTNGVITWTPTLAQAGTTNVFTTIVTNYDVYAPVNQSLSATDSFTVIVNPLYEIRTALGLGAITTDGTNLYVRAYNAGDTNYLLAMTPPGTNITTIYSNLPDALPDGLAWYGTNLFWIDPNAGPGAGTAIFRGDTNGDLPASYFPFTLTNGCDLASDGTQLFAVDAYGGGVSRLQFDFTGETNIGAARYPRIPADEHLNTLAVQNGVVYVADSGQAAVDLPQVVSLSTNGGAYAPDYAGPPFVTPGGVAVSGGALFVVDAAATNTLWLLPVSGATNLTALASGPPFRNLQRVAYMNHALYVTDDDTNGFNGAVIQIPLPNPAPVFIGESVTAGGVTLRWTAPIYDEFEVQWTDDLTQPWNTDTIDVITSSTGIFTFTDNGSHTAPFGAARYYRLVEISP